MYGNLVFGGWASYSNSEGKVMDHCTGSIG